MKKNIKKITVGLLAASIMAVSVAGGAVFADTSSETETTTPGAGYGNGQCGYCQSGELRNGEFRNGAGFGAGAKRGMGKGNRTGPKDGTGIRAQDGTCLLEDQK
ncbi:MAG: hypothetical protein WBH44_02000 [Proteocatella sp.]